MNAKENLGLLAVLGVALAANSASAQPHTNGYHYTNYNQYSNHWFYTNDGAGGGQWWTNMARWSNAPAPRAFTNQYRVMAPKPGPRVEPPGQRPAGPLTPADVQGLVQQFQQDREAFMAKQQALEQQMKGQSAQERQRLRDQLKDQMEQWKQQQARLREQLQDQCDRLADQLRDHTRLMDRVANPGTPPGGSGSPGGTRPRGR